MWTRTTRLRTDDEENKTNETYENKTGTDEENKTKETEENKTDGENTTGPTEEGNETDADEENKAEETEVNKTEENKNKTDEGNESEPEILMPTCKYKLRPTAKHFPCRSSAAD